MSSSENTGMVIVSACLTGMHTVNYPSYECSDEAVLRLLAEGRAIPLCPEQIGGLPTPRPPAGFVGGGTGAEAWTGARGCIVRVVSTEGDDFTEAFLRGAQEILRVAKLAGAKHAILHDGSPSCGVMRTSVYNQAGELVHDAGCGVLTWLLQANGIQVDSPESWRTSSSAPTAP